MDIDKIIEKLKKDTNNASDITYREKKVWKKRTEIIYIESLTNSDKISDFIIRSLDKIDKYITKKNLFLSRNRYFNFERDIFSKNYPLIMKKVKFHYSKI